MPDIANGGALPSPPRPVIDPPFLSRWRDSFADQSCQIARQYGLAVSQAPLPEGSAGDLQASFLAGVFHRASVAASVAGRSPAAVADAWHDVREALAAKPDSDPRLTEALASVDPRPRLEPAQAPGLAALRR